VRFGQKYRISDTQETTYFFCLLVDTGAVHSLGRVTTVLASVVVVSFVVIAVAVLTDLFTFVLLFIHLPLGVGIDEFLHGSYVFSSLASVSALVGRAKLELNKVGLSTVFTIFAIIVLFDGMTRLEPEGVVNHPRRILLCVIVKST